VTSSGERRGASDSDLADRVHGLQDEVAALPVLDDRAPEEIIGYDEHGLPA